MLVLAGKELLFVMGLRVSGYGWVQYFRAGKVWQCQSFPGQ